jgi:hypothetical protein
LKRFGLLPFGVYRIVLGMVVLATLGTAVTPTKPASAATTPTSSAAPR